MLHAEAGGCNMNTRDKLLKMVGVENFSHDPEVLKRYSKDFSLVPPGMPNYVIKPKDWRKRDSG
jgi:hypothetical protein